LEKIMIAEDGTRMILYAFFLKAISKRVEDAVPELPKESLQNLSLAGLLNLLFLLRGEWSTLGDYTTTRRVLRTLLGDKLLWSSPQEQPEVPTEGLVH
jgi:hypothetical protein